MTCHKCGALPYRKHGGVIVHRATCPEFRNFADGSTAIRSDPECTEIERMRTQVDGMADILDELSIVLTNTCVPDWRVLPPIAAEIVKIVRADVRLATSARTLATQLHAGRGGNE